MLSKTCSLNIMYCHRVGYLKFLGIYMFGIPWVMSLMDAHGFSLKCFCFVLFCYFGLRRRCFGVGLYLKCLRNDMLGILWVKSLMDVHGFSIKCVFAFFFFLFFWFSKALFQTIKHQIVSRATETKSSGNSHIFAEGKKNDRQRCIKPVKKRWANLVFLGNKTQTENISVIKLFHVAKLMPTCTTFQNYEIGTSNHDL